MYQNILRTFSPKIYTVNQTNFTIKYDSQTCNSLDWLKKRLKKASFKPYEWESLFFRVISAFFRIAVSWSWKIEHLLCLSYLSQYYALRSTWLFKQQFVIRYSARILHGLMGSKTMKYKLISKQLKIQSKSILIHGQYALKANILMYWKQLDHGDLYKQAMTTCTSTKVLGVKVFYLSVLYKMNSEKYLFGISNGKVPEKLEFELSCKKSNIITE